MIRTEGKIKKESTVKKSLGLIIKGERGQDKGAILKNIHRAECIFQVQQVRRFSLSEGTTIFYF